MKNKHYESIYDVNDTVDQDLTKSMKMNRKLSVSCFVVRES